MPFIAFSSNEPEKTPEMSLQAWRVRVLNQVLKGVFIFWLVAMLAGIYNVLMEYRQAAQPQEDLLSLAVYTVAIYTGTTVMLAFITFNQRIKFELRAGLLLFSLYILGTIGMFLASFSGDGRILFFAFIILTAIFFDNSYSLIAFGMTLLTLVLIGYLQVSGILVVPAERQVNAALPMAWVSGGVVFLVLSIASLASTTYLLRAFEKNLNRSHILLDREQELARALRTLSDVNQLVVRERDRQTLLARACQQLVKSGDYEIVWTGLLDPGGVSIHLTASYGTGMDDAGFPISLAEPDTSFACVVEAVRSWSLIETQAFFGSDACLPCKHRTVCPARSAMIFPLMRDKINLGVFVVDQPRGEFRVEEIRLLQELSDNLAFALEKIDLYDKLELREAYFRALIENSTEGVAILDATGTVKYLAPSEKRLTGYDPSEIVGRSAFQYIHPEDLPRVVDIFTEGVATPGVVRSVQYRLLRKDGEWRAFEIVGRNLLDDPHIRGVVVNYRDVTDRQLATEAMQESEERYRTIFESAGVPIWEDDYSELLKEIDLLRQKGVTDFRKYLEETPKFLECAARMIKITNVNHAVVEMMGARDKTQLIGTFAEVFNENPSSEFIAVLAEGRNHHEGEAFLFTLQGKRRDVWVSVTVPSWTAGLDRVLVSTLDITERKMAERAVRESQSRLAGIIDTAMNAIITINDAQCIVLFNPFAERIFGCSAEYAIGKPIDIFIPERFRRSHPRNVVEFGRTSVSSRNHGRLDSLFGLRVNGEEFPMEAFISQHQIEDEKFYTVILRDITDRKLAEENLKRRAEELQTLVIVSSALRSARTVNEIIPVLVRYTVAIVDGDLGTVYLLEESTGNLISPGWYSVKQGEDIKVQGEAALRHVSYNGITGYVAKTGQMYITNDLHNDPLTVVLPLEADILRNACSGISLPLLSQEKVVGVLHIRLERKHIFTETETRLLTAIAEMAGSAIQRAMLHERTLQQADELSQAYDNTLAGWARALELRDELTEGHTRRVTDLTLKLADRLNIHANEMTQIRRGALLHDIGKMGIPDSILRKPGPLTASETRIMQLHPQYAFEMLSLIPFLCPALDIPFCHHERWDGKGYPRGLKGDEIPLAARIFSVVDVWDALTSDRPYRKAWSREQSLEYIKSNSGVMFDPTIVETFIAMIEM